MTRQDKQYVLYVAKVDLITKLVELHNAKTVQAGFITTSYKNLLVKPAPLVPFVHPGHHHKVPAQLVNIRQKEVKLPVRFVKLVDI